VPSIRTITAGKRKGLHISEVTADGDRSWTCNLHARTAAHTLHSAAARFCSKNNRIIILVSVFVKVSAS